VARGTNDKVQQEVAEYKAVVGDGGEIHQIAGPEDEVLTTQQAKAFGRLKFIGFTAAPLLAKAGMVEADIDDAIRPLSSESDAKAFVKQCGKLRFWQGELAVDLDADLFVPD
jgi:hypothetical protein